MIQPISPAGANDGDVVDVFRDVWIPIGNPDAALAVLLERPLRGHQPLEPVPIAVMGRPKEQAWAGRQLLQSRFGSNRSR